MAICMLASTKAVLGSNAEQCDSRSLFIDRFAEPQAKKRTRPLRFVGRATSLSRKAAIMPASSAKSTQPT